MSTSLDKYRKVQTDGPDGAIFLDDWNGLLEEVGAAIDELRTKATGFDAVAQTAIEVLLDRVKGVLGPAFEAVAAKAAQVDERLALLNGAGVSADAVIPSATRTFVTPEQRALINTAAQAADLKKVAQIGATQAYLSGF